MADPQNQMFKSHHGGKYLDCRTCHNSRRRQHSLETSTTKVAAAPPSKITE
jgi:hypothetical protein